jgi:rubrerythrin
MRRQFEMNWDNELKNWAGDWDEMGCREIIKFKKEKELFVYLEAEMEGERSSVEYIYHNLKNQKKEDRASMFRDIIEYAIDLTREYDESRRLNEQAIRDEAEHQRLKQLAQKPEFKCEDCPVCWEKLEWERVIPICGHPICLGCRSKVNKCPTCRNPFR